MGDWPVSVRWRHWTIRRRAKDQRLTDIIDIEVTVGDSRRHVQVTVSPTGRSIRVFLDGTELKAADDG